MSDTALPTMTELSFSECPTLYSHGTWERKNRGTCCRVKGSFDEEWEREQSGRLCSNHKKVSASTKGGSS